MNVLRSAGLSEFSLLKNPVPVLYSSIARQRDRSRDKKMNATLSCPLSQQPIPLSCQYQNYTNNIQVVCISNVQGWFFERTVFPGQMLFFEAPATAILEVHTGVSATAIVADRIPCHRLATSPCRSSSASAA